MRFQLDYVPSTFDNAIAEVSSGLTPEEREQLVKLNSSELSTLHLSLGANMRDAWSLWDENTPLRVDCKSRGLPNNADDLSMFMLEAVWKKLKVEGPRA